MRCKAGLTFNGHPVALAAAVANIRVMQKEGLIDKARETGLVMRDMLAGLVENHPSVGDVRSIGLFGILELVRDRQTKEPMAPFNGSSKEMEAFKHCLLDQGIYLYTHWHTALLLPPLIITAEQLEEAFTAIDKALAITDAAVKN